MKALELTVYPKLKWPRSGAEIEPAMTAVTPAACLRLAEALDVDAADYPIVRELVSALKELVKLNEEVKP